MNRRVLVQIHLKHLAIQGFKIRTPNRELQTRRPSHLVCLCLKREVKPALPKTISKKTPQNQKGGKNHENGPKKHLGQRTNAEKLWWFPRFFFSGHQQAIHGPNGQARPLRALAFVEFQAFPGREKANGGRWKASALALMLDVEMWRLKQNSWKNQPTQGFHSKTTRNPKKVHSAASKPTLQSTWAEPTGRSAVRRKIRAPTAARSRFGAGAKVAQGSCDKLPGAPS